MVAASAVATLLVCSCVKHHRVTVSGTELHRGVPALRANGVAKVSAVDDRGNRISEPIRVGQSLRLDGRAYRVSQLIRNCRDVRPFLSDSVSGAQCRLVQLRQRRLEVRRFKTRSAAPFIGYTIAGVVGAGIVGAAVCEFACEDGSTAQRASRITLGVTGALLGGSIIWLVSKGAVK